MVALYHRARWALLPTVETTKTIIEMCATNLKAPTKERIHFTKVSMLSLRYALLTVSQLLPETEYTYIFLPITKDENEIQPIGIYVKGELYPFTDFPLVKTTLHPCFLWESTQLYTVLHASICDTAGIATNERRNLTITLLTQMDQPINLSWFIGTDGRFPSRLPFYNPRPDPTPESDEHSDGFKKISGTRPWIQTNPTFACSRR